MESVVSINKRQLGEIWVNFPFQPDMTTLWSRILGEKGKGTLCFRIMDFLELGEYVRD